MTAPTKQDIQNVKNAVDKLVNQNLRGTPYSRTIELTSDLQELPDFCAKYISFINNENELILTVNGGDEITILDPAIYDIPYITNTKEIQVKGTGTLSYIVYA